MVFLISWKELISSTKEPDIFTENILLLEENLQPDIAFTINQKIINFCEKLHSYFHFEQAFFHLKIAEKTLSLEECDEAIKQVPFNKIACKLKNILIKGGDLNDLDKYQRPYKNYQDFLTFLGLTCDFSLYAKESYWHYYELYLLDHKIENLYLAKNSIIEKHQKYHAKAAEAYYNRALVFKSLGQDLLFNNDLVKVKNLNPSFKI